MGDTVKYELNEAVATITLDDGKVNVLGPAMQSAINEALDRAEKDSAKAVVIAGNQRVFSGGFDLAVFQSGDAKAALGMLAGGFELSVRCLTFPAPVIMAATGPAIAMGSFLLLSGDHRIGQPKTRCQAIEVAIGMTIPISAIEIMRARLTPAAFHRGTVDGGDVRRRRGDGEAVGSTSSSRPTRCWRGRSRWRPRRRRRCTPARTWRPN